MDEVSNFCPAMAVPMTVKIPDPITAPIPSAVSETGPSVFFRRRSGACESEIRLSMELQKKSWFSDVRIDVRIEVRTVPGGPDSGSGKRLMSPEVLRNPTSAQALGRQSFAGQVPIAKFRVPLLPLRRAARQLLHFALLRSARVLPRLQRVLGFALLARGAFQFLAFVFA